ncbi:G-protein coupled receptor moody [Operophtera brumata]|uniref:G-protein coupled receptor moody n=1 Tax=Operophtera brumata TaxID=104452 RepID=A0A0L7KTY4_OPEBR|nr:G-protein coupled receptor moody [Operophtera brumata]
MTHSNHHNDVLTTVFKAGMAEDIMNITDGITASVEPSELSKFSPGLLTFAAIITGMIMVVGLFGNLLTVVALLKCPKVRNVAAAFIISLCIADFLFCAVVLPFAISGFWTRTWSHGGALCKLVPFLRYIMIAHHSWYARVYRKYNIALMIVFSWMFSYGMQIPTLFDYDPELGTCSIVPDDNGMSAKTALFVIAFIHTSPGSLNNSTADKRSTVKDNRETKVRRNEWRITKMVLAIFLSFLVCYLPITIAKVADNHPATYSCTRVLASTPSST